MVQAIGFTAFLGLTNVLLFPQAGYTYTHIHISIYIYIHAYVCIKYPNCKQDPTELYLGQEPASMRTCVYCSAACEADGRGCSASLFNRRGIESSDFSQGPYQEAKTAQSSPVGLEECFCWLLLLPCWETQESLMGLVGEPTPALMDAPIAFTSGDTSSVLK